jgi:hypothetical protein
MIITRTETPFHNTHAAQKKTQLHCDRKQTDGVTALRKTYHVQACSAVRQNTSEKQMQDMAMTQRHRWAAK